MVCDSLHHQGVRRRVSWDSLSMRNILPQVRDVASSNTFLHGRDRGTLLQDAPEEPRLVECHRVSVETSRRYGLGGVHHHGSADEDRVPWILLGREFDRRDAMPEIQFLE